MTSDLNLLGYLIGVSIGLLSLAMGLRMLLKPKSLTEKSMMYRYMVQRMGYLSKEVANTGQLSHRQIRIYGACLVVLALISFGIVLL